MVNDFFYFIVIKMISTCSVFSTLLIYLVVYELMISFCD